MNLRDMELTKRIDLMTAIEGAERAAHAVDTCISVSRFAPPGTDWSRDELAALTARRESDMVSKLAEAAELLGFRLVTLEAAGE